MANVTMTREQYEALLAVAQGESSEDVLALRKKIDDSNGIKRYFLLIRWLERGADPVQLGKPWPPEQQFALEQDHPISRDDVDTVLETQATEPTAIFVTLDRNGKVGLTALEDWDFTLAT